MLLGLFWVFAMTPPALAQTAEPAWSTPELRALKPFFGTWSCTTTFTRRPNKVSTSTWEAAVDKDGRWVIYRFKVDGANASPPAFESVDYTTYDSFAHQWVDVSTDNTGGYSVSTSPGPIGNTWIWHDLNLQKEPGLVAWGDTTVILNGDRYTLTQAYTHEDGKQYRRDKACIRKSASRVTL